jgi:hypothetical protein
VKATHFFHLLMAGVLCSPAYAGSEAPRDRIFGGSAAVGAKLLDSQRGGTDVGVLNVSRTSGTVRDNLAYNVSTGSNSITDGALAGAAGLPLVVQNSGNNVLIQNSTIVNMQVQ